MAPYTPPDEVDMHPDELRAGAAPQRSEPKPQKGYRIDENPDCLTSSDPPRIAVGLGRGEDYLFTAEEAIEMGEELIAAAKRQRGDEEEETEEERQRSNHLLRTLFNAHQQDKRNERTYNLGSIMGVATGLLLSLMLIVPLQHYGVGMGPILLIFLGLATILIVWQGLLGRHYENRPILDYDDIKEQHSRR